MIQETELIRNAHAAANVTLHQDGGTFSATDLAEVHPEKGYAVGGFAPTDIVNFDDASTVPDRLMEFIAAHQVSFIGTWVHEDDIYIDGVAIIEDRAVALTVAAAHREMAIWDFSTNEEIQVAESNGVGILSDLLS